MCGGVVVVVTHLLDRRHYNLGVISRCGIHEIVSLSWRVRLVCRMPRTCGLGSIHSGWLCDRRPPDRGGPHNVTVLLVTLVDSCTSQAPLMDSCFTVGLGHESILGLSSSTGARNWHTPWLAGCCMFPDDGYVTGSMTF